MHFAALKQCEMCCGAVLEGYITFGIQWSSKKVANIDIYPVLYRYKNKVL